MRVVKCSNVTKFVVYVWCAVLLSVSLNAYTSGVISFVLISSLLLFCALKLKNIFSVGWLTYHIKDTEITLRKTFRCMYVPYAF